MRLVVDGARGFGEVPGLEAGTERLGLEVAFAPDRESLARALAAGAEVLLGWDFRGDNLAACWAEARSLKWIQWAGAGVDAVLFDALVESDVVLTNARGIYERAMAEYALGLILAHAKDFWTTAQLKAERAWRPRLSGRIDGTRAAIVGVGGIGREMARLLKSVGISVSGVGRRARQGVPEFGAVEGREGLARLLPEAQWVIGILPSTAATRDYFDAGFFGAMKAGAYFINLGRGNTVDEQALLEALEGGHLSGAALDVFKDEPLPGSSPFWRLPNVVVSPHMSGDYRGFDADVVALFLDNCERWREGRALRNVVDKRHGYVRD